MFAPELVVVHPLVLLSVVDHYQRVAPGPGKRVVGVLLGHWVGRTLNVTNCYAVPFEENDQDSSVWFLDHNYHENMSELYKKVNAKERPVGWYHSGPKLRSSDFKIHDLFRKYSPSPILVIIDPVTDEPGTLPINSYVLVEEVGQEGRAINRTFAHINSQIEAEEAEEIGVEHLLRDAKGHQMIASGGGGGGAAAQQTIGLSTQIHTKLDSLKALHRQLSEIQVYLDEVLGGRLPLNHPIIQSLQDLLNLLPDVHAPEAKAALTVTTNDQMAMVLVGNLTRSIIALHELIDNKISAESATMVVSTATNGAEIVESK